MDLPGEFVEGIEDLLVVIIHEQKFAHPFVVEHFERRVSQVADAEFWHVDVDGPLRGDAGATARAGCRVQAAGHQAVQDFAGIHLPHRGNEHGHLADGAVRAMQFWSIGNWREEDHGMKFWSEYRTTVAEV